MSAHPAEDAERYREYLGLLGRLQSYVKLMRKVDLSGVVRVTLMEAYSSHRSQLDEKERLPWLRRVFANNLLDEIREFCTLARDVGREQTLQQAIDQSASRAACFSLATSRRPEKRRCVRKSSCDSRRHLPVFLPHNGKPSSCIIPKAETSKGSASRWDETKVGVAARIYRGPRNYESC